MPGKNSLMNCYPLRDMENAGDAIDDVARYSDTNGMDENIAHPEAYRYRDYVIKSFNQDKPFNQFIIEQLAGDLLPSKNLEKKENKQLPQAFFQLDQKCWPAMIPIRCAEILSMNN